MPPSPIRSSSTPPRTSAHPVFCKPCASARCSWSTRSVPVWWRPAPCWPSCRRRRAMARSVLGRDLFIPNVATWWLVEPGVREEIVDDLDGLVIAPAFESHLDQRSEGTLLGSEVDDAERRTLIRSIRNRGVDYVAQEAVTLSSMPVWRDGRLQPRPFTLRIFLARVDGRWQTMPGGFVRIADTADAHAVSLERGAATADAWLLARGPVAETTLLPAAERIEVQRASGLLPSRAADNLFWVGRYVERAEATLRLVRAMTNRAAE